MNNAVYQSFDIKGMLLALGNGVEYLPVRDLTLAIDCLFSGYDPAIFHGSNVLYYLLNIVAVFFLTRSLCNYLYLKGPAKSDNVLLAFLTSAFFAAHPIHSEAVSFITCRNVLLSGLFFFISIICFVKWRERSGVCWYLLSLACFVLALLSKATTVVLPLMLMVLLWKIVGKSEKIKLIGPFFLVSLFATGLFVEIANRANVLTVNLPDISFTAIFTKVLIAFQIPFFYLYKLIVPMSYTIEYDIPFAVSLFSAKAVLAIVGCIALITVGYVCRKRHPVISLCVWWYFITLIPVMNLLPTYPCVADRYAYLPSYSFCLMLAYGIVQMNFKFGKRLAMGIALPVIAMWSFTTFKQNKVWKNEQTLFENAVQYSPKVNKVLTSLGRIYFKSGRYQEAIDLFERAQQLDPRDPHYDYFRGVLALNLEHNVNKALYLYEQSTKRKNDFIEGLFYAGFVYEKTGNTDIAKQYYQRAIDSREYDVSNLRKLAIQSIEKLGSVNQK